MDNENFNPFELLNDQFKYPFPTLKALMPNSSRRLPKAKTRTPQKV
jgi:hypothetical protein